MKKPLLLLAMIGISLFSFGQTYLLEEFFDDPENLPSTFTTIDQDGDGYIWRINTWESEVYAVSDSWLSDPGALTPENYLVTPKISLAGLSGTVTLRYTVQVADEEYFEEKYKVALSTTGNQVADFSNVLFTETTTLTEYYVWKERLIDLTPFIGEDIYLTWCHFECTDMYKLLLDSIQVIYNTDVSVNAEPALHLSVFPNPATDQVKVSGDFENAEISLFTADGRQVYRSVNETKQAFIPVSRLEKGVYILRLQTSSGTITRKVNVTH
ncbi:MAG: choice-of-anchor J domain-containing protein [Bacteroidales bacterium]|nr:choice-of-anchor J domain-containing protein [Bacteroidales bacterium]